MNKVADSWLQEILILLAHHRTITRLQILEATGINPASVSHALRFLMQAGVILKVGELASKAGRRQEVLKLNADVGFFVAADLEGTKIRFALTNLIGDIRYRWEEDIPLDQELQVRHIVDGIERVLGNLNSRQRARVVAIGVCHPGFSDAEGRITAFNLGWNDFPLREKLSRAFTLPVYLEDSHRTHVATERSMGVCRQSRNCVYLILGQGVGVGCFVDDHLLEGTSGAAGELGHITCDPTSTIKCSCGKRGCLETIASSPSMVRQYVAAVKEQGRKIDADINISAVFEAARRGDTSAIQIVDRAADSLAVGLSYLVQILNPEIIVFGGDIIYAEDLFLPRIRARLATFVMPKLGDKVRLLVSSLGLDIGLRGAAAMAFRRAVMDTELLREKICQPVSLDASPISKARRRGK